MNDGDFNIEMRKFLKHVGITSQREIERAVDAAVAAGSLGDATELKAVMTLEIPALNLSHRIEGSIALDKD